MVVDFLRSHFPCSSPLASQVVILNFPYDSRCLLTFDIAQPMLLFYLV